MFKKFAVAASMLWLFANEALAAQAGHVVFVTGQAQIGGHIAVKDVAVQEGDELSTGADGYVYVQTVDNGFLILRPNTIARVVTYSVAKDDPSKTQVKLELLKGVARTISGQGVKHARQNFRFNTPVAAIGVRGTDFTVFTDQQTTRVTVLSGGVVMSGFSANCTAAGTGPCEGRNARELSAGQGGLLLQVERGSTMPQLLTNPALAPDQAAKPRSDEPQANLVAPVVPMAQVNLDPQRSDKVLSNARPVTPSPSPIPAPQPTPAPSPEPVMPTVPGPVIVTPPVVIVEPSRPIIPAVPEVFWGRWEAVVNKAPALGRIGNADVDIATYYGSYAITRLTNSSLVMPNEGTAAFKLMSGEAIITNSDGDRFATVESGKLNMDFAQRTFATSLIVRADRDRTDVIGSGVITDKGMLYEDKRSDTVIRGFLGGANADQAGYIFKNYATPGVVVSGATSWSR